MAQAAPQPSASKRIPLASLPGELRMALQQTWDKDGTGYVTIGELCAGATGGNSPRNARQSRIMAGMGKHATPTGARPGPPVKGLSAVDQRSEMPGDFSVLDNTGLAEGQGIWERMAAIIRRQRLDVRILLDAHDRRNTGLVDMDTFRRALCYAFGNHWIELGCAALRGSPRQTHPAAWRRRRVAGAS
jgi:hypothetical protein